MWLLLVGLCPLLLLLWWWYKDDPTEPPVMPGQLPFLGHGLTAMGNCIDLFNAIKLMSSEAERMGGVLRIQLGPFKSYCVVDPEDSYTVLNECVQKHYIYDFVKPLQRNGLLTADVTTWKRNRKLLNPAFSQQVLDGFIDIFNSRAASLVEEFEKEVGQPFDHEKHIRICNLETICETSLGVQPGEFGNLRKSYLPYLEEALLLIAGRIQKFWYHIDFLFNLSSYKKKQDDSIKQLYQYCEAVLKKKKAEMDGSFSDEERGKLKPFIYLLMELAKSHPGLTESHILGEINTIIVGGHDTSATSLTFALTLVGSYPEVLEKAYQEIQEVLGNSKRYVTKEDLSKLVYIDAIVKETLRLYPPTPVVARQLDKDIKLKNYTLKGGSSCVVSIYGSHRHAMWGPDAHVFRPERWLEKDSLPSAKYYAAFGLGRRACIGKSYALMSFKISLVHVIRRFHIAADESKIVVKMYAMIRPEEGHHITLMER